MATVTVQPKGKCWYTVISYKDEHGKWRNKMQTTGLPIKSNKKRAEKIAAERLANFHEPEPLDETNPYLDQYLKSWLKYIESRVERSTYGGYESSVNCVLVPYFEPKRIKLKDFTLRVAQQFYDDLQQSGRGRDGGVPKPTTVRRYHAALHNALEHAVKLELIEYNPTDRVDLPRKIPVIHNTFKEDEMILLNKMMAKEDIAPLIMVASEYGLRRSELCGLKWKAIDFDRNEFTVAHTVVVVKGKDGKSELVKKDRTKNASSHRKLPMSNEIRELFLGMKRLQEEHREFFGPGYNEADAEYVFVDVLGNLIKPNYLSRKYARLRDEYGLPHVTLHEIRHTVATLMLEHGVGMKFVQMWLGHSDYATTANIYAHPDDWEAKNRAVKVMSEIMKEHDVTDCLKDEWK